MKINNFYLIPDEIKLRIFYFLTEEELVVNTTVSKLFNNLLSDNFLWKHTAVKLNIAFDENKNIKECIKEKSIEIKKVNTSMSELFRDVLSGNLSQIFEKSIEIKRVNTSISELSKCVLRGNLFEIFEIHHNIFNESYSGENSGRWLQKIFTEAINNDNLNRIQALCYHGFEPRPYNLFCALVKKNVEIVKFLMNNFQKNFEETVKQEGIESFRRLNLAPKRCFEDESGILKKAKDLLTTHPNNN